MGGCAAGWTETDTFAETACAAGWGYDKCLSYAYSSTASGCTTTYSTGMCSYDSTGYTCASLTDTWQSYDGFSCNDCDSDNCNDKNLGGGGGSSTATEAPDASSAPRATASIGATMLLFALGQ